MAFHWSMYFSVFLPVFGFGYLCGSIPFGLVLTRLAGTVDLRAIGSGNIGATNVLRTGRKDLAAATLVLDGLKGTFAVLVTWWFFGDVRVAEFAALGAFTGHLFPVWLGFRGGKGVAVFLGCLLGLAWPAGLTFAALWLSTAYATRYSSAAALVASAATPLALWFLGYRPLVLLFTILAAMLWYMHRANIGRLRAGTEGKIGGKS